MQKLGIYAGMGYSVPIEERLAMIKGCGFQVVCLNFEKDMEESETSWDNQVRLAQRYSLPVEAAHLTGTKMNSIWSDGEAAEYVTVRLITELQRLREVGVPVGVAHITWGKEKPAVPTRNALHRFERIAEAAEKYDVLVALENSAFSEPVHYVLQNIRSDHVGFCYDSGHENAFTPSEDYLTKYGERMMAMHLHDNDGVCDNHYVPLDPDGTIDWGQKMRQIKNTELGKRNLVLEVGKQKESLEEVLKSSYEAAVRLANM